MKLSQSVVLIVDDDSNVRNFLSLMVQQKGYSLLAANDGQEALTLSRSHRGDIDLLVSDVNMPRMNGIELAGHIRNERRGTRVLIMSGLEQSTLDLPFLRKPFLPDEFWRKLDEVFAEPKDDPLARALLETAAMPEGSGEN